ncbi:MAG: HEPN domain-containing protein [Anaerolineae bacterium]
MKSEQTAKRLDELILSPSQQQALAEVRRRLFSDPDIEVEEIVLYGSVARGEADEESDLDLLVVTAKPLSRAESHEKITHVVFEVNLRFDTNISTLVVDRDEWETGLISVLPIRGEILRDGVPYLRRNPSRRSTSTNTDEQRAEAVRRWWAMAQESLASAKLELEAGHYTFAINRIYYAAFYGVSAALFERRLSFKRHSGVRTALHRELIKSGLLDTEWGEFYDDLFRDRHEGDYNVFASFDREHVESQLVCCTQFLAELRPLITLPPQE